MTPRAYLDTSAYVSILAGEPGHEALTERLGDTALVSSTLLVIETERSLIRLVRERRISPALHADARQRLREDVRRMELRDLDLGIALDGPMPEATTPRTLDLIHLRTALWFHTRAPLRWFVSLDTTQTLAARELGLPV